MTKTRGTFHVKPSQLSVSTKPGLILWQKSLHKIGLQDNTKECGIRLTIVSWVCMAKILVARLQRRCKLQTKLARKQQVLFLSLTTQILHSQSTILTISIFYPKVVHPLFNILHNWLKICTGVAIPWPWKFESLIFESLVFEHPIKALNLGS